MAKAISKRSKKFLASGGIAAKLAKGTVTKKGKVLFKRRSPSVKHGGPKKEDVPNVQKIAAAEAAAEKAQKKRDENDFVTLPSVMASMDVEEFFREAAEAADQDEDVDSVDHEQNSEDEEVEDDSDKEEDDDDESSVNSEDIDMEEAERLMKAEMSKLSQSDPEFHKFLAENERSLLEFGEDDEESDDGEKEDAMGIDDEGSDDDEKEPTVKDKKKAPKEEDEDKMKPAKGQIHLTPVLLKSLEKHAFGPTHGIKGLRNIVSAYRTACHLADPDQQQNAETEDGGNHNGKYFIDSAVVFDRLMVSCMKNCDKAFRFHLLGQDSEEEWDENKPIHPKQIMKSPRWKNVHSILKTFLRNTIHVISEAKEPGLLTFVLKSLSNYAPFLTPFPRMAKGLLKTLSSLWAAPFDDVSQESYQAVRLHAFLRIRQLAVTQPFPFIEDCLKQVYLAYAKNAKFTSEATLPALTFMGNCVVELYSLDIDSAYQHAFVYIRQLALHLRSALQKKTKEALKVVYCWQFLNCCKVWTAVLCANPGKDELYSLVYPLTEIILGVLRLLPSARYLPLRLHCVRMLQQLASSTETFIPTTGILLDALELKEFHTTPKGKKKGGKKSFASNAVVRLPLVWKLPKEDALRTMEQMDTCITEVFVLLNREVDLYRYSAGCPEFSVRVCQRLRKFAKETKVGRWRAFAKGCIEMCERYSAQATAARSELVEAPKDIKRFEILKPQGAPNMKERYEAAIAKEKTLEAASQPKTSKAAQEKEIAEAKKGQEQREKESKKSKNKEERVVRFDAENDAALDEADEVEEGVDWSDGESSGDEE